MPKPQSVFALGLPATLLAALTLAVLIPATASAQPASEDCGTATIVIEGGDQRFELPRQRNETLKLRRDSTLKISVINVPPDSKVRWGLRSPFGVVASREETVGDEGQVASVDVADVARFSRGVYRINGALLRPTGEDDAEYCLVSFEVRIIGFGGVAGWTSVGLAGVGAVGAAGAVTAAGQGAARKWDLQIKPQIRRRQRRGLRRWVPVLAWKRTVFSTLVGAFTGLCIAVVLQQGGVAPLSLASAVRGIVIGGGVAMGFSVGLGVVLTYLKPPAEPE